MKQIKRMLLYVDAALDPALLDRVVHIARAVHAELTLAAVVKPARSQVLLARGSVDLDELERLLVEDQQRQLEAAANSIDDPAVTIKTRVFVGDQVDAIIQAVAAGEYDLVLKQPSPTFGLRQHLFGSIDMRLLRACPCPVSISLVKPSGYTGRAVAAVDYDEEKTKALLNRALLDFLVFSLETEFTEVYVVHAWSVYGESMLSSGRGKVSPERLEEIVEQERSQRQQWLENLIEEYRRTLDDKAAERFQPKLELLRGDPAVVIPERVQELDADLLSIGTVSRTGLGGWLIGNTAEAILGRVRCTVVTHKPEGFQAPLAAP